MYRPTFSVVKTSKILFLLTSAVDEHSGVFLLALVRIKVGTHPRVSIILDQQFGVCCTYGLATATAVVTRVKVREEETTAVST